MDLLFMSADPRPEVALPALGLLAHGVRVLAPDFSALVDVGPVDIIIVDARTDLGSARGLCRVLAGGATSPVLTALFQEGGLVALSSDWGIDDFFLASIGPAELDARLRLLRGRASVSGGSDKVTLGELVIDEGTYTARLRGRTLDLTYKEFELLKYLCQHAGRVFTRAQLLQEVWGYDFFGGTRTVDVHVRRLRAKLGPEYEALIGTVRNVGYKAVRPNTRSKDRRRDEEEEDFGEESEPAEQAAR
jgi:DNA-binding response OmpR family regulator